MAARVRRVDEGSAMGMKIDYEFPREDLGSVENSTKVFGFHTGAT